MQALTLLPKSPLPYKLQLTGMKFNWFSRMPLIKIHHNFYFCFVIVTVLLNLLKTHLKESLTTNLLSLRTPAEIHFYVRN